jgi:hypothetical protein
MSARNGDKARFQKDRKRTVLRRAKIRELVKATAAKGTVAVAAKAPAE